MTPPRPAQCRRALSSLSWSCGSVEREGRLRLKFGHSRHYTWLSPASWVSGDTTCGGPNPCVTWLRGPRWENTYYWCIECVTHQTNAKNGLSMRKRSKICLLGTMGTFRQRTVRGPRRVHREKRTTAWETWHAGAGGRWRGRRGKQAWQAHQTGAPRGAPGWQATWRGLVGQCPSARKAGTRGALGAFRALRDWRHVSHFLRPKVSGAQKCPPNPIFGFFWFCL